MIKTLVAVALVVCCIYITDGQAETCSKMTHMLTCLPDLRKYMERPINLTMVILFSGASKEAEVRCKTFNDFTKCVDDKMRSCTQVTDAQELSIVFWDNARVAVDYICNKHWQDFVNHRTCLTSSSLRQAAIACDLPVSHYRRKRDTCADYEAEIKCSDKAVRDQCGAEVARHVGFMARTILKNTPHTKDCVAPALPGAAGITVSAPVLLGICMAAAKLMV